MGNGETEEHTPATKSPQTPKNHFLFPISYFLLEHHRQHHRTQASLLLQKSGDVVADLAVETTQIHRAVPRVHPKQVDHPIVDLIDQLRRILGIHEPTADDLRTGDELPGFIERRRNGYDAIAGKGLTIAQNDIVDGANQ